VEAEEVPDTIVEAEAVSLEDEGSMEGYFPAR